MSTQAALVHPSRLQRWFEQLCRFPQRSLQHAADGTMMRLRASAVPSDAGVYAFWWTGHGSMLARDRCNRLLELAGPGGRPISIHFDDEWLGLDAGMPIPLYVGKTATGLNKRVGQHLMLGSDRVLPLGVGSAKAPRPTTSCQLRAGIDQLFPEVPNTRALVLENVSFSHVVLPGDENAANRFYLEDLAVGLMRPVLNIDVER